MIAVKMRMPIAFMQINENLNEFDGDAEDEPQNNANNPANRRKSLGTKKDARCSDFEYD